MTLTVDTKKSIYSSTVVLLTLINLINYLDRYLLAAVGTEVQKDLGINNFLLGLLMSAFMIGYMVMSPFFGYLGDRYSRPILMGFGVLLWSIATILSGFANGFIVFFLARICVGVGEASYASIAPSYIRDEVQDSTLTNKALAFFYTAIPVGAALGFICGGLSAKLLSWHWGFFIGGLPGLVLAFIIALKKDQVREISKQPFSFGELKSILQELATNRAYKISVLGYTAYTFALGGFAAWAPKFGISIIGGDIANINNSIGLVTVVSGILGTVIGGKWGASLQGSKISNSVENTAVDGFNRFCMWTSIFATPFAFALPLIRNQWLFMADMFMIQTFMFAASAPINTALLVAVRPQVAAIAMAFSIFVVHALGDLISPPIVGLISDYASLPQALFLLSFFVLVSAVIWSLNTKVSLSKT